MEESSAEAPNVDAPSAPRVSSKPVATVLVCVACIVIFIGIKLEKGSPPASLQPWGYVQPIGIWRGRYWGALTAIFVHTDLMHVGFNVYWLWVFGSRVERRFGTLKYSLFFVLAAIVCSGAQLGISGETGFGASGVGYALFGLLLITRKQIPEFAEALTTQTIQLFVLWFFACIALSQLGMWKVAVAGPIAGVIFGAGVGAVIVNYGRALMLSALSLFSAAALMPLFWAPWTSAWASMKAYEAVMGRDNAAAIQWCKRITGKGSDRVWALTTLIYCYDNAVSDADADSALQELRQIDPQEAHIQEAKIEVSRATRNAHEADRNKDGDAIVYWCKRYILFGGTDAWAPENIGYWYVANGKDAEFKAALEELRQANRALADRTESEWSNYKGEELQRRGDSAGAVELYRRSLELNPGQAMIWEYLMCAYADVERMDECKAALKKLETLDPERAKQGEIRWRNKRAYALQKAKDHAGAVGDYRRSLELNPAQPIVLENLAQACSELDREDECKEVLARLAEIDPDRAKQQEQKIEVYHSASKAHAASGKGDAQAVILWCKRYLKAGGKDDWAPKNLGYWYALSGKDAEFKAALETLRSTDEPLARMAELQWLNVKGAELHRRYDLAGAIELYRRSLELDPAQADAWDNLARAYAGARRMDDCKAALERLRALDAAQAKVTEELIMPGVSGPRRMEAMMTKTSQLAAITLVAVATSSLAKEVKADLNGDKTPQPPDKGQ